LFNELLSLFYPRCPQRREGGRVIFQQSDVNRWQVKLRNVLSKFTPSLGYGACRSCHLPWWVISGHTVMYSSHGGCFSVCESCWHDLSAEELWPFYEDLLYLLYSWNKDWETNERVSFSTCLQTCRENLFNAKGGVIVHGTC
jgi:hypothetical protein